MMSERVLRKNALQPVRKYSVVAILGSRQVGKTTLAKTISAAADIPKYHLRSHQSFCIPEPWYNKIIE